MNLENLTTKKASNFLLNKKLSSVQLTEYFLEQIKKLNPKINAYISILEKEAIEAAEESDKRYAKGEIQGPIDGIPIAVKDNMAMEGTRTTAGSKILENFIASYDATVISKLKKAGAVIIGKTNMDEFAMGSSTENSAYGPTKNPHDKSRVPGGSSGGSAVAVAADLCVAALGSDTGGSIRQPASFCGIVGFKPTYGMVSRYGLLAMASSLDQIGPMTKTVEDAKILFNIIKGQDEKDATSLKMQNANLKNQNENLKLKIKNLRIGMPREYFGEGMEEGVEECVNDSIEKLRKLGAEIIDISLPNTPYALAAYYLIMPSEVSSNLARYDGIKYGISEEGRDLIDVYKQTRAKGFGEEAKRRIMLGTFALSAGYYEAYYLKAKKVQAKIKEDFDKAFEKVDLLVTPTSPTTAFKIGERVSDPLTMYLSDIFTISVNLAGLAAISVPCGLSNNLPVGLQFIGNQFDDDLVLNTAGIFEIDNKKEVR